jgi:fucose permease
VKAQTITLPFKSTLIENGRFSKTAGYSVAFIMLGLSRAVIGPTLPILAEQTHVSISAISILFTATALGGLVGSVAGGWLYDRLPGHPIMTAMLGVIAVIFLTLPIIPSLWLLTGLFLLLGIAEGTVDLGGNTLLVWVHREKVGSFMNALHFCYGIGAFLSPLMVGWIISQEGNIMRVYMMLALLILPIAVGLAFLPSPRFHASTNVKEKGRINSVMVGGVAVFFFLYAGAEVAFGGWIYTYAVKLNLAAPTQAAYLTSIFWGALTLGRLLSIPLAARLRPVVLLFGSLSGCLVSLALIWIFPHSVSMLWAASCGIGLSMAAIFPTTLSFSERRMPITGQITGFFFVGACLGAMSIPWGVGQVMQFRGPQSMMALLIICIVAAGIVLTGICLKARTRNM